MENAVAVRPSSNEITVRSSIPSEHEMMVFRTMATHAVTSKMYGNIAGEAGVMMIMLAARELGISPMQALNGGLNIINGKVEISARMMSALIRRCGHQLTVKESSDNHCVLFGKRADTGEAQQASFSIEDAKRANLIKPGGGWTKFPKDMCFARALSRLARQLFSDVIGMGYVEGEISQVTPSTPPTADIELTPEVAQYETEEQALERFAGKFPPEEKEAALLWFDIIQKHFEWSIIQTVEEVCKDEKKMFDKFKEWKSKHTQEAK